MHPSTGDCEILQAMTHNNTVPHRARDNNVITDFVTFNLGLSFL